MEKCIFYILLLTVGGLFSCGRAGQPADSGDPGEHSAAASLEALEVAEGLEVSLFASEPMISNPTNIDVDARGRVWVTEGWNYRNWLNTENPYREKGDRIMILEDTNRDGRADTAKIFYQDTLINSAMGIAVLGNKVIVSCSPNVFLLTDTDGDDKADKRELLFTGIGGKQHDHAVHAFVFGPDGKLYFNFGNEGKTILDKDGKALHDRHGRLISADGAPYRQGMAFRCNPDGSGLEVIGYNFRNPYELAVDSYGSVWQTDNDDDGNRSTRVNYVMEYGNYGYTDQLTGAYWGEWRINREDSVPLRHWHQDDPGVVPNLLVNGAGSPSGMCIYEGSLLPAPYRGQIIHAEAGRNAVRAYPVTPRGAGFTAERVNLLFTTDDKWFRPVDVCAAPDGSLMVADWYDPGVGGHRAGDVELGRIYRIAPKGHEYRPGVPSLDRPENAVQALASPAQSVRYLAWMTLHEMGSRAEPALRKTFTDSPDPRLRARALWLLTKLPEKASSYLQRALEDENERIRAAAVRAARQMDVDLAAVVEKVVHDPSALVRRTALIALHDLDSPEKPSLWARLAASYDGNDRWYLEALGIAAENDPDACFSAWLENGGDPASPAGKKIVWRSRARKALPLLAEMAAADGITDRERRQLFRGIEFHRGPRKQELLLSLIKQQDTGERTGAYALMLIDPESLPRTRAMTAAIENSLQALRGKPEYVRLIARFDLRNKAGELMEIALDTAAVWEMRETALQTLLKMDLMENIHAVVSRDDERSLILTDLLEEGDDDRVFAELQQIILNENYSKPLRREAVGSLGGTWTGCEKLMVLAETGRLPAAFDSLAKDILTAVWRPDVLARARAFYNPGETRETLPDIPTLLSIDGDPASGAAAFTSWCSSCHVVNGSGIAFGPELSAIGAKLSNEALYDAIIHPDKGINFGFEGYTFHLKDGSSLTGYIAGETSDEVSVRIIGGQTRQLKAADILSRKASGHSLMPSGLGQAMGKQQLADLVAYLSGLKAGE